MKPIKFTAIIFAVISLQYVYSQSDLNWNIIYKLTSVHSVNVGDVTGHTIGSAEGTGLGFLPDKKNAVMSGSFTFDYVNGSGPYTAYYTLSFEDGSGFTVKCIGKADYDSKLEKTLFEGDIVYISGKGVYEGITGSGKIKGKRSQGIETGAAVYLEITSTYEIKK